jgi:hypothetical protein
MTAKESQILRELIDKNWDFTNEQDITKKWEIGLKVSELKKKLQDSMGKAEYDKFMDNGRKMFAPKG